LKQQASTAAPVVAHGNPWKWLLIIGICLLVLGIAGLGVATFLELTSLLVFGSMLLVSAVLVFWHWSPRTGPDVLDLSRTVESDSRRAPWPS
jgi:uncharacterized membrane protein HdeD (DUF308 family)